MLEQTYWTFWFYKSANKRCGISLTNRGPKLEFQTHSQEVVHEEDAAEAKPSEQG